MSQVFFFKCQRIILGSELTNTFLAKTQLLAGIGKYMAVPWSTRYQQMMLSIFRSGKIMIYIGLQAVRLMSYTKRHKITVFKQNNPQAVTMIYIRHEKLNHQISVKVSSISYEAGTPDFTICYLLLASLCQGSQFSILLF